MDDITRRMSKWRRIATGCNLKSCGDAYGPNRGSQCRLRCCGVRCWAECASNARACVSSIGALDGDGPSKVFVDRLLDDDVLSYPRHLGHDPDIGAAEGVVTTTSSNPAVACMGSRLFRGGTLKALCEFPSPTPVMRKAGYHLLPPQFRGCLGNAAAKSGRRDSCPCCCMNFASSRT